jgi:membrane-bound lytic murein transglycosylase B
MDRRAFLVSTAWLAVAPAPDLYQGAAQLGGASSPGPTSDDAFEAWKAAFIEKAVGRGLPRDRVTGALAGVISDPHVVTLDQRQPEFSKPISGYINSTVSASRIAEAQSRLASIRAWLDPIADHYQVPPPILVSIWGMESNFGQIQGDDDVIRSYSTLAAEGRRQAFAEDELIGALRILFSGEATRGQLKGSWAGAMGQTQFTPLDYLQYAVDGDGDGKRDIWGSAPDALASTANFMARKAHWQLGQSAQIEVAVHAAGFDYALVEGPAKTPGEWAALGVAPVDPRGTPDGDRGVPATLIMPMGWQGPGFLAFPNHMAIRAYNNSTSYALAVGLLADRIAGGGPLVQAWPADQPISLEDRKAAQQALISLGYYSGEVDGLLGTGTRKAARQWQASQGLPPDGYLSYALIQKLKAQTGIAAAPANPPITPIAPTA